MVIDMNKTFTVQVSEIGGWWSAICPELCVSGMGSTKEEAVENVTRSMRSTLRAMASMLKRDHAKISQFAAISR